MGRYRSTVLMGVILLALLGYLFLIEFPQQREKEKKEEADKKAFIIDKNDILSMTVRTQEEEVTIVKQPEDDHWKITSPLQVNADSAEIKNVISTITDLRIEKVVTNHNEDPTEYGFDHPAVTIAVSFPDGNEEVIIGDDSPINNMVYVQQGSTKRVVLANQWIKDALTRTFFDLRDKSILSIDPETVTEVRLDFPNQKIRLLKEGDEWILKEPKEAPTDLENIKGLIYSLSILKATGFIDSHEKKRETWGRIESKDLMVTLVHEPGIETVSFHRTEVDGVIAITHKDNPIYKISESTLGEFNPDVFYYLDKHLIRFENSEAYKIAVTSPAESYTLIRSGGTWFIDGRTEEVDQSAVASFFVDLKDTEARRMPDTPFQPPGGGLDLPQSSVTLYNSIDKEIASLAVGAESSGLLFARGTPTLGTVLISHDILDQIPRSDELIKTNETEKSPEGK